MIRVPPLPIIGAALAAALVAVIVVGVMTGGVRVGPAGAALVAGGTTLNSMQCVGTGAVPSHCLIEFTVDSGANAIDINLAPAAVKTLTENKFTSTGSLTIKAGKPGEVASYSVKPQTTPIEDWKVWLMNKWFKETRGWEYRPGASAKSEVSLAGSSESCRGSYGAAKEISPSMDFETRESFVPFGDSFHEFVCGEVQNVGRFGTLPAVPDVGTEVTLYFNGQPVKVGRGPSTAPSTASIGGIGTVTFLGSLATGLAAPSGTDYAAAWIFNDKTWRVIPNSLYTEYPRASVASSMEQFQRDARNTCGGQGMGAEWTKVGVVITTSCTAPDPGDAVRFRFVTDTDKRVLPLRSANAEIAKTTQVIGAAAFDLTASRTSDSTGDTGGNFVIRLDRTWGNPRIQITLDASGIQAMGITVAAGKPRFISLIGQATTGAGGTVQITAANDGNDASFQFTATCTGVSVSPVTQEVRGGATVTASLPVSTLGLAADLSSSCTGTVTDRGSGAQSSGSGTLSVARGSECVEGQVLPRSAQQIDQCQGGRWVTVLTCPQGTTVELRADGTYKCSAPTAGAVGGPTPTPFVGAPPPAGTPKPAFVSQAAPVPWLLIVLAAVAISGIAGSAFVVSRRRRSMPPPGGLN